jgi:hypothetical protein
MARIEMLLWDGWGVQNNWVDFDNPTVPDTDAELLDEVAAVTVRADVSPGEVQAVAARDGLAVPRVVECADPMGGPPVDIDVSRQLGNGTEPIGVN